MQNFNVIISVNGQQRFMLAFNFENESDFLALENRAAVIGTICHKFSKFMAMNKRWKQRVDKNYVSLVPGHLGLDFEFQYNGLSINSRMVSDAFNYSFKFRLNDTIQKRMELFLNDAIELCTPDKVVSAKFIDVV
jgi:hypothetical protein